MANVNGTEIDLKANAGMKAEARKYRQWKAEGRRGGTSVARDKARQILSGQDIPADWVVEMNAWFARHEADKQGEGFRPGEDGYPSPGRVAWAAWGGDAGQAWSGRKSEQIKQARERNE